MLCYCATWMYYSLLTRVRGAVPLLRPCRRRFNHGALDAVLEIVKSPLQLGVFAKGAAIAEEQVQASTRIFRQAFAFMKELARGCDFVQQRLFEDLDAILAVPVGLDLAASALVEVFTGNKKLCLSISSRQVRNHVARGGVPAMRG